MTQLGRQAWWSAVKSGACAAMILAAACGGAESPRTQAETPPQSQAEGRGQSDGEAVRFRWQDRDAARGRRLYGPSG